jgi:hypothetical protein
VDIDVSAPLHGLETVEIRLPGSDVGIVVGVVVADQLVPRGPYQLGDTLVGTALPRRALEVEAEHIRLRLRRPGDVDDLPFHRGLEGGEIDSCQGLQGGPQAQKDDDNESQPAQV